MTTTTTKRRRQPEMDLRARMGEEELLEWALANGSPFGYRTIGLCVACGAEVSGCEPDTRYRLCEHCGAKGVFGAEELAIRLVG